MKKKTQQSKTREWQTMATLIAPKQFSPVEDAENIKKACQGFFSSFFFSCACQSFC
jgi:hypothetical protein